MRRLATAYFNEPLSSDAMKTHLSYAICLLAVTGLAFSFQDGWRGEGTPCPDHALAARLTGELQFHGAINTSPYEVAASDLVERLVVSNSGVCLISESGDGLQSRRVSLYREPHAGLYFLIFDDQQGGGQKLGFGPIPQ